MINKKQKGITLVALIITIIVMMILVGVSVSMIINSDLLGTAKRAGGAYTENAGNEANLGEITIDGITYASVEDYLAGNPKISNGQYEEKHGVYVNRPDLTGFSRDHTYFVTYDANGANETIGGKINTEEPKDWYDYQNKIWANIMTKSDNGKVAYLVWIPRYCYKITYYTTSAMTTEADEGVITGYGTVDVKFLSRDNIHKDYATGAETEYSTLATQGYILPETFTWKVGTSEETALAGYWVSKYESQYVGTYFNITKASNSIAIKSIDAYSSGKTYEYYLNGNLEYTGSDLYTFENLEPDTEYEIKIMEKYSETERVEVSTRKVRTIEIIDDSEPKTIPDVTGFKNAIAYYVTYDENGANETIGDRITFGPDGNPNNVPKSGWYDYKNKIWANIVTASEELIATEKADIELAETKNVAYLVWIPRYEYRLIDTSKESDYLEGDTITKEKVSINFISTSTVTPTIDGYTIPETFVWKKGTPDEIQLSGYWVAKYESSDLQPEQTETEETGT